MPVISINKKYLYGLIGQRMDDEKLADYIYKLGFEVESQDEKEAIIEITANRLDLLDAVGLARTIKNFMHKSKRFHYEIEDKEPAITIDVDRSVGRIRPYISGLVALNLELTEESLLNLINFSEKFCETYGRNRRKIAMGFHDMDAIKGGLTYKASEDLEFVPLGKQEKMKFSSVLEKEEKGRQYGSIIKNEKRCFYPSLSDSEGPIALIPILNSQRTKVTASTKSMFIDITGLSEYAVNKAAELLAASFIDMGAEVRKVRIRRNDKAVLAPEMEKRYINIPISRAEREIGVDIGYNNIISLANKMGYEAGMVGNKITFRIPEYRLDIIDAQDVIEDIAIGYGYDYINATPIAYSQPGNLEDRTRFNRKLTDIMIGLGFFECTNSYLTNEENNFDKEGLKRESHAIMLKNSNTETITMMRTWLMPSLLNNLRLSSHESMPQNVFELDMAFSIAEGKPVESYRLAAVSVSPKSNFNEMKAMVEGMLYAAGVDCDISEFNHPAFIDGRCAKLAFKGKEVGFFGELHPRTLKNFGIEEAAVAIEMQLDPIYPRKS